MQWYVKEEERLRYELKQLCLEDHLWFLKSWDQNGVGVIKVHCAWTTLMLAMYESNCCTFGRNRVVGMSFIARMMLALMVHSISKELLQLRGGLKYSLSTYFHMQEEVEWRPLAVATPNLWLTTTLHS